MIKMAKKLFQHISKYDEDITDQFFFNDSEYGGADTLLQLDDFDEVAFAISDDDENVTEHYFFLEANANHLETDEDMILVEMDGIKFVLIDLHGKHVIAVNKASAATAENLLTE